MSFSSIEKTLHNLKEEYEALQQFQDTYQQAILKLKNVLVELFEEPVLKQSPEYNALKVKYHDFILEMFHPKNYRQLVVETNLPSVYDPPGANAQKLSNFKKFKELSPVKKEKIAPAYAEPDLMPLKINETVYYIDPDELNIYEKTEDNLAKLVGLIRNSVIKIGELSIPLKEEEVYAVADPKEPDLVYYQSVQIPSQFYEKLQGNDAWVVGLEKSQITTLKILSN